MTFASFRQIVALIVLTAGLLFAIDRIENPRRAVIDGDHVPPSGTTDKPMIRLSLNGECFGGCRTGLEQALSALPWLEAPRVVDDARRQVVVGIKDPDRNLPSVDFVTVLAALRKSGFAAAQMEFSGVPHYGLEADLPHLCSPECVTGTRGAMDELVRASRPKGWFRWLDSYRVDGVNQALVIYPRMGETVDVMEVLAAINTIGFEPSALTVRVHGVK